MAEGPGFLLLVGVAEAVAVDAAKLPLLGLKVPCANIHHERCKFHLSKQQRRLSGQHQHASGPTTQPSSLRVQALKPAIDQSESE
jgi:hypothetical protein